MIAVLVTVFYKPNMPYLLKQLPHDQEIRKISSRFFNNMDPALIKISLRLLKVGSDFDRVIEGYFESHGLSYARFSILFLLMRSEPELAKQTDIAQRLELSRASVTGFLNSLENDGLIERRPCPNDKRAFLLRLTRSGREIVESLLPGHIENLANFIIPLKRDERVFLEKIMDKLMDSIELQTASAKKKRKSSKKK